MSTSKSAERVDIHAVAKRAKVSVATVSRTINHIPTVAPDYAQRVWEAIHELGYIPNTQARALVSGRSRIIGIIISDITNPFFPELIQSFEEEAVEANYEILIGSTAYDSRRMELCIDRMLQRKVDGVAVMTFGIEEPLLDRLAAQNIPLAFIDIAPDGAGMSAIKVDYDAGIREAVLHLASLGHRRLAFIAGPKELHSAQSRKNAFLSAAAEFKIKVPPAYLYDSDHTLEGGIAGMRSFLKCSVLPTAIMCSNDMTAIGVLHAAAAAKLRIPDDISVIGFDDIHIARFTVPPLTTVRMSCQELARSALKALRSYLEKGDIYKHDRLEVRTRLKLRESTSAPRETTATESVKPAPHRPAKKMRAARS
jgi:DNA-binding LacI/PurR family transcriptional regulator